MRKALIIGVSFWREWKCPGGLFDLGYPERHPSL